MASATPSYDAALLDLAAKRPRLAAALQRAEARRAANVASLLHGARFKGLEELLKNLDDLTGAFESDAGLSRLATLLARSMADFETAIEACLSGYLSVAVDAMRDVMEVENLLLDFAVNPAHIDQWLTATPKDLRNKFNPATVRRRLHEAGEGQYASSRDSADYRAHSAALHASPHRHPLIARGFLLEEGFEGDAAFWELFEHARRLRLAIRRLVTATSPGSLAETITGKNLLDVEDAWQRTQEMQAIYLALWQAAAGTGAEDDELADPGRS
jgi:hypothetical protein